MKKVLIIIAVVLAVCLLAAIFLFDLFDFDNSAAEQKLDEIEEKIEERTELDGNWLSGGDAELEAMGICAVDIVWNPGDVTVSESEGDKIIVNAGDKDALEYQVKNGTLYISNTDGFENGNIKLKVLIPEDLMIKLVSLNVVTSAADVYVESEGFAAMNIVTASGNVSIDENEAMEIEVVSASGNITICTDEDDAFMMDYASESGEVSVSFDSSFKNESTADSEASYDHSFGNSMYQHINAVTASGSIKLIDD